MTSKWKTHRWRRGERHPKARLSDHDVEFMRQLHDEYCLSVADVARKFDVSYWTARDICKYRTRAAV